MTTDENHNVYSDGYQDEELWAARLSKEDPFQIEEKSARRSQVLSKMNEEDPMLEDEKPRFKLLNRSELKALPDPEWLVHGTLPADSFTVIYGAPGAAKSFAALDVACSIASGHTFHGAVVKRGQVLVAVGEGLRGMKWREEAWGLAHLDSDQEALERNLHILPKAVHLLEQKDADMLVNTAEYLSQNGEEPLRLVIIDTWARAMVGGDENSAKDAGMAIEVCERIRHATGATVLVVHHTGAEGTRERGSTALRGASDTSILMVKEDNSGIITLSVKKMKDGEPPIPTNYTLSPYGHSAVLQPSTNGYTSGAVFKKQYPSRYGDAF